MINGRLVRMSFPAMGTECVLAATSGRSDPTRIRRALAAARDEIEACERVLSRFRPESDLSRLNAARGAWARVDERLVEALRVALRAREDTEGRFDPTILPALAAVGYDRSFEQLVERAPVDVSGWRAGACVEIDPVTRRARLEPDAAIDLGGIAKGLAADRALSAMRDAWVELPGALVDLGGDIAVRGVTPDGGPWRIAVADPRRPGATLGTLGVEDGTVATSGRDVRRFGPGRKLHHLIDPDTGLPAAAGPLAVTVVGGDAAETEAYATALAITPIAEAAAYLESRPGLSALLVPGEGDEVVVGDLPLLVDYDRVEVIT